MFKIFGKIAGWIGKSKKLVGFGLGMVNKFIPNPPDCDVKLVLPDLAKTDDLEKNLMKLLKDAVYFIGKTSFILPVGFTWDGASIPGFAWLIVGTPFEPKFSLASALHDYLYRIGWDRVLADLYFYWILLACGVDQKIAENMYYAVRVGGWKPYNDYQKRLNNGETLV